jgi:Heat shock factor binding protein 1
MENPASGAKGDQELEKPQSTADMTTFVQNLLVQMQTRFQAMSEIIVQRIDEMESKTDDLKKSTNSQRARVCDLAPITPHEKFNLVVLTLELEFVKKENRSEDLDVVVLGLASIGDNTARLILDLQFLFRNGLGDDVEAPDESRQMPGMSKPQGNIMLSVIDGEFPDSQFIIMLGDNGTEKTNFICMLTELLKPDSIEGTYVEISEFYVSYKP